MHAQGEDWELGDDGVSRRRAARVLVLDAEDRLLLIRGHDADQPERSWWFTVGGGIDAGETPREAAVREAREEAGLEIAEDDLVGPVWTRSAVFEFASTTLHQDEEFYLVRLAGRGGDDLSREGWTDVERDVIDELAWWDLDELAAVRIEVFPVGLADMVRPLLDGWDGRTQHLGEQHE